VAADGRLLMVKTPPRSEAPLQVVVAPGWARELGGAPARR
jgi:hypothetical protein